MEERIREAAIKLRDKLKHVKNDVEKYGSVGDCQKDLTNILQAIHPSRKHVRSSPNTIPGIHQRYAESSGGSKAIGAQGVPVWASRVSTLFFYGYNLVGMSDAIEADFDAATEFAKKRSDSQRVSTAVPPQRHVNISKR